MSIQLCLSLDSALAYQELYHSREPSISTLGLLAEWAGAQWGSLTFREDRVDRCRQALSNLRQSCSLRLELRGGLDLPIQTLAYELQPDRVTLIPSRWSGPTVLGGLDLHRREGELQNLIRSLRQAEVEIAVQLEPRLELVKRLHRLDADMVTFSTHALMSSGRGEARRKAFGQLIEAAALAARLGLRVSVSGGLDLVAVEQVSRLPSLQEFQIGQSCLARAMVRGVEQSVRDFLQASTRGREALI
ncbi:MAG: pyridoxine 5'-phosphate synthase [Myxococcota bacterium]|nr:pyridoxine 5'-phosphate synthase [Myxococcota bacterium]